MKVLVVDDDVDLLDLMTYALRREGYNVLAAVDGQQALQRWESDNPDIVLLDGNLPKIDGFEVCRRIRAWSKTPILMLTARGSEDDRILGLDLGADDYLVKPFSPRELVSRVKAILRRVGEVDKETPEQKAQVEAEVERKKSLLHFPGLALDLLARRVEVKGSEVALTPTEFDLLALLAQSPDRVFTREVLMNKVWGYDYLGDGHTIDVHISSLRKKIELSPELRYIKTVWRVGYRFEVHPRLSASS